jgi:hypothetical protein
MVFATVLASAPWLMGCPADNAKAPPGGEKAAAAAREEAEKYAQGLRRGIVRGQGDRARSDLQNVRDALEKYAADASAYPDASSCADLASALGSHRFPNFPDTDPWGGSYDCRSTSGGYSLRSAGEDRSAGTADDLVLEGGTP